MYSVVELQIYSRGNNPRFVLSHDDDAEMRRLVEREFARNVPSGPGAPRLGYQGFIVYDDTSMGSWQPRLRVVNGVATPLTGPYAGHSRRAPAVERHLIDAARRAHLGPVLDSALQTHGEGDE